MLRNLQLTIKIIIHDKDSYYEFMFNQLSVLMEQMSTEISFVNKKKQLNLKEKKDIIYLIQFFEILVNRIVLVKNKSKIIYRKIVEILNMLT